MKLLTLSRIFDCFQISVIIKVVGVLALPKFLTVNLLSMIYFIIKK